MRIARIRKPSPPLVQTGKRAATLFERLHAGLETVGALVLPALSFLLGAVLIVDAVLYFVAGGPLFTIGPVG